MKDRIAYRDFEYFSLISDLPDTEGASADAGQPFDLPSYVRSAWLCRQSDSRRALALTQQAERALVQIADDADRRLWQARLLLIRGEIDILFSRDAEAQTMLEQALAGFTALGDGRGIGDVRQALSEMHISLGNVEQANAELEAALAAYGACGDGDRALLAECRLAYNHQYQNVGAAQRRWNERMEVVSVAGNPAASAFRLAYLGGVQFQLGNFPAAIASLTAGFDTALAIGAYWLATGLANSVGASYANLFDLATAMEWKERSYEIAKPTEWPMAIGSALASMAETTTSLKQYDRAREYFDEALPFVVNLGKRRKHVIIYNAYANLLMEIDSAEKALPWFVKAEEISQAIQQKDVNLSSVVGMAACLLKLGRVEDAAVVARRGVDIGREIQHAYHRIRALQALADVRRASEPGNPAGAIAALEEAVALGETLDRFTLQPEIYNALSRDYESMGDHEKALNYERRARDSWQRNFDKQNGARILAMQARFDTARAKAEAEHHRKLAEAEAARAAELDRANQTLERLGAIGQEITARLDSESVFTTLSRHLHDLMHANTLFVGLKDEAGQIIDIRYRMEDGKRLPSRHVPLASDNLSARCVRDNEEILVAWGDNAHSDSVPGTRRMRTVLFRPLALGDRVLGVVSVQSDRPQAYGPRELLIFRTICAYGAIAMANAEAYQQLDRAVGETREALQRLVQQEKMAALGQLVAGVAHEVNTPLGVTLSAVSQLNDSIRQLHGQVEKGVLTRSVLTDALENGRELAALAQRNVTRAADMIRTFKGVAVDHGSDERRVFELGEYLAEIMSLIRARVAGNGNRIEIDVVPIQMDTYPGALAQVITNLVSNIADHAYAPDRPGRIILRGRLLDAYTVEIAVVDQGNGIPSDILPRVFDPFFTTRRAAGSMGLGLHVVFNQVTQRLNGSITIDSVPGQGTVAALRIPREVPGHLSTAYLPISV